MLVESETFFFILDDVISILMVSNTSKVGTRLRNLKHYQTTILSPKTKGCLSLNWKKKKKRIFFGVESQQVKKKKDKKKKMIFWGRVSTVKKIKR